MNQQQELDEIERRAEFILGSIWRDRETTGVSLLSDQIGILACFPEGLLGLQRAGQIAGARAVRGTLWQVHDARTRYLIERFYKNVWEKRMSNLDALRDAQRAIDRGEDLRGPGKPSLRPSG